MAPDKEVAVHSFADTPKAVRSVKRSFLLITIVAAGCGSTPTPRPPVPPTPSALTTARSIASRGIPSSTPELDALAALVAKTTPSLGLKELVKAGSTAFGRLRPGDSIEITVLDSESFSGQKQLRADGTIDLGVLGALKAGGRSATRLATEIKDQLLKGDYLQRPVVSVALVERSERVVQVVGRVGRTVSTARDAPATNQGPSVLALPAHRPLTVYDLIAQVNGLGADADGMHLTLIRRAEANTKKKGRNCYHFTFAALVEAHLQGQDAWLVPDDQLVIPRLPTVQAHGAVLTPGPLPLRAGMTVASLLVAAGGATPEADANGVLILSGDESRSAQLDDLLAANDVVYVPVAASVYVVGAGVPRGGPIVLPPAGMSAIQAIGQAGWFGLYGDRDGVYILRLSEGKQLRIRVPVDDILEGTQSEQSFMLLPGDTLFVPEAAW